MTATAEEMLRTLQHELRTPISVLERVADRISEPELQAMVRRQLEAMQRALDAAQVKRREEP